MRKVTYDREQKKIKAGEKCIVDFSSVEDGCQATLCSKLEPQAFSLTMTFNFDDNERSPFNLQHASLTPSSFVKTVVEHKLDIPGLKCAPEINDVYDDLNKQDIMGTLYS